MPYIPEEDREALELTHDLKVPETAGELNYVITAMLLRYLGTQAKYADYNEVIGVLECVKQELYRRRIVPYEQTKKDQHGDVY